MRWCVPFVIVALVVAGSVRPAQATRASDRASMSASSGARATAMRSETSETSKLAPRRGPVARGAMSERRSGVDEVFVVPRIVELLAAPTLTSLVAPMVVCLRSGSAPVEAVARGPPFVVVPSSSHL